MLDVNSLPLFATSKENILGKIVCLKLDDGTTGWEIKPNHFGCVDDFKTIGNKLKPNTNQRTKMVILT